MSKDIDPVGATMRKFGGAIAETMKAAINGNIPQPWRCVEITTWPMHDGNINRPSNVALRVKAVTSADTVEIKIVIASDPDAIDQLKIADEAVTLLRAQITRVRPGTIRFALEAGAIQPTRGSDGASGYDLYAPSDVTINPGRTLVIHTGVMLELPTGWEGQVRPRSSMSKRGLLVSLGTIDQDYRGVIGATITSTAGQAEKIAKGDRIAQLVFVRVEHPAWHLVNAADLTPTQRGAGGFGSSGR